MVNSLILRGGKMGMEPSLISMREKDILINYIKNNKEHHKTESFYDEYRRLLIENGIEFEEKYLL